MASMTLKEYVDSIERGGRLATDKDFSGVTGRDIMGSTISSDDLRDMYSEGLAHEDDLTRIRLPQTTIGEAPDKRLEKIALGERLGSRPGRIARNKFELQPTRVAYNRPEGLIRGRAGDIHMNLMARNLPDFPKDLTDVAIRNTGAMSKKEKQFWLEYEKLPEDTLDEWEQDAGFTGRSGSFVPREEAPGAFGTGESLAIGSAEKRRVPSTQKAMARAESTDPTDMARRRLRAERAQQGLKKMEEERRWLSRISRFAEDAGPNIERIQTLTKRIGRLKNAARSAGVMGLNAAAMGLATPFTTGEALMGLRNTDKNVQLKSIETILGLPDRSTGRGMTDEELEQNPGVQDPVTGKGYI